MSVENEKIADIVEEMRGNEFDDPHLNADGIIGARVLAKGWADRIEAACKREAESIERIVRDAIIDYQEMYQHAPNDDAERELIDRANRGNAWLVSHGYEQEKTIWDKEETPCL